MRKIWMERRAYTRQRHPVDTRGDVLAAQLLERSAAEALAAALVRLLVPVAVLGDASTSGRRAHTSTSSPTVRPLCRRRRSAPRI
jgi:hypothetical protein